VEIHFWEDEIYNPEGCIHGWVETKWALLARQPLIHTTQMGCLSTNLLEIGYRVFLGESKEIKLGKNDCTGRDIRTGHNLFKLWDACEFDQ